MKTLITGLVGAVAALLLLPLAASADFGVGVAANPLSPSGPALPGHVYKLPPLYVLNTGSEASDYTLSIKRITPGSARTIPASWLSLQTTSLHLQPKQSAYVQVTLNVPEGAAAGDYFTNIVAATAAPGRSQVTLGAAAAAKVAFKLVPASDAAWSPQVPSWAAPALGAALLVGLGFVSWRRLGIRIEVRGRKR